MTSNLVIAERQGPVLVVKLNSPDTRNSLSVEMRDAIGGAILMADRDRSVRSVFISGEGASFCSGGNFKMLKESGDTWSVHRRFRQYSRWLTPLTLLEKPVVIGVHGHAVGGGMGLALTGDVLIAGESAQFLAGFFRLGAIPDIGVMYQLPRLIGMARTKNFLYGGEPMLAAEALALGLVKKVVPDSELFNAGLEEASRLASGPAEVMGLTKVLLARSYESTLDQMFTYEGLGQALAMSGPEFREGFGAALEKRKPDFPAAAGREGQA